MDWREKAKQLYFEKQLRIGEVAVQCGKSRQSVSAFLHSVPEWTKEKQRRADESKKRRRKQKQNWEIKNRSFGGYIDVLHECVRREHRQAVAELSRERYH